MLRDDWHGKSRDNCFGTLSSSSKGKFNRAKIFLALSNRNLSNDDRIYLLSVRQSQICPPWVSRLYGCLTTRADASLLESEGSIRFLCEESDLFPPDLARECLSGAEPDFPTWP